MRFRTGKRAPWSRVPHWLLVLLLCLLGAGCYSFELVDPGRAMLELRPHDTIRVVTKTGERKVLVVTQLVPPDVIYGNTCTLRVGDLRSIHRRERAGALEVVGDVIAGTIEVTLRLLPLLVPCH